MAGWEGDARCAQGNAAKRILIVEDEFLIAMEAQFDLSGAGYDVVLCPDGKQGLALALSDRFDLIITDYMMPKMNGVDMIHAIRANGVAAPIVLTSSMSPDAVPTGPYDRFMRKPYRPRDIRAVADHFTALRIDKAYRSSATKTGILECVDD